MNFLKFPLIFNSDLLHFQTTQAQQLIAKEKAAAKAARAKAARAKKAAEREARVTAKQQAPAVAHQIDGYLLAVQHMRGQSLNRAIPGTDMQPRPRQRGTSSGSQPKPPPPPRRRAGSGSSKASTPKGESSPIRPALPK